MQCVPSKQIGKHSRQLIQLDRQTEFCARLAIYSANCSYRSRNISLWEREKENGVVKETEK